MILLAPQFFWWALAAAVGIVAAHLLVTRQPPSHALPTVRFVPEAPVRAITIARRPDDRWLMLLRILIVLLIGLAMAKPVAVPARRPVARVVLWDRSGAVADPNTARDSVLAWRREGDVVVGFDTAAGIVEELPAVQPADARVGTDKTDKTVRANRPDGRLSAALIVALRSAARLRASADSLELVIVSPLTGEELNAATPAIRALWPGRIRLVRVPATAEQPATSGGIQVIAAPDDPLTLVSRLATRDQQEYSVRISRLPASASDSSWAASGPRVLVRWPAAGAPPGWKPLGRPDTVGAVIVGGSALVYPFARSWGPGTGDMNARAIARWSDGTVAAVERSLGLGCIRDVAVPVEARGDFVLRADFARFFHAMTAPCGQAVAGEAPAPVDTAFLAGSGPLAAASVIHASQSVPTPLTPWLLGAALVLSLVELAVRRKGTALAIEADA